MLQSARALVVRGILPCVKPNRNAMNDLQKAMLLYFIDQSETHVGANRMKAMVAGQRLLRKPGEMFRFMRGYWWFKRGQQQGNLSEMERALTHDLQGLLQDDDTFDPRISCNAMSGKPLFA